MDVHDLMKILKENEEQLNQILSDCKSGPSELVLLASKMDPLLTSFASSEAELLSSLSENNVSTEQLDNTEA